MKYLSLLFLLTVLSSCTSHTIRLRANHFATPVVADSPWSGSAFLASHGVTQVMLVDDMTTNPPQRGTPRINQTVDGASAAFISGTGFDANLSFVKSVEVFVQSSYVGLRWQFLNHGPQSDVWVATLHGAYSDKSESSESTSGGFTSNATSRTKSIQGGLSLGYKFSSVVPYVSVLQEKHDVSTIVVNSAGEFPDYTDGGRRDSLSVGISSHQRGFSYAFEYSMINIEWDRAQNMYQNSLGGRFGFAW